MNRLASPLKNAVSLYPESTAIIEPGGLPITYRELGLSVAKLKTVLSESGISAGMRVGILAEVSVSHVILLHALLDLGAVACPVSTRNPDEAIERYIKQADIPIIITDAGHANCACGKAAKLSIASLAEDSRRCSPTPLSDQFDIKAEATMLATSGSTAEPKIAVHSHGNHYYSAIGSNRNIPLAPGDRWLLSLPLYHVGGLSILFRAVNAGSAVVIPAKDIPIANLIRDNKVTHISVVSTQLRRLIDDPAVSEVQPLLKAVLVGGGMIEEGLIGRALEARLPVYTTYGMTETASQLTASSLLSKAVRHSGRPLEFREIKISRSGEITVRGQVVFKGYLINGRVLRPADGNGYLPTGDTGIVDNDGNLIVTGRLDSMFISGGENIYPEEIETVISKLFSHTRVLVVPVPDTEYGQRPAVFIDGDFDASAVAVELRKHLPSFKVPALFLKWPDESGINSEKPSRPEFSKMAEQLIDRHT